MGEKNDLQKDVLLSVLAALSSDPKNAAEVDRLLSPLPPAKKGDILAAIAGRSAVGGLGALVDDHPDPKPLDVWTADSLLSTTFPEPVWAVPGLLPAGLTILAGAPKTGKSWLALQLCLSVTSGGCFFGERLTAGRTLYLALEDAPRRLQERMNKQGWTNGLAADFMTLGTFEDQIGDLRTGGGERLARAIETRGYKLVILDTLSRAIQGKQKEVEDMTGALSPVQGIAQAQNCAVLVIDHHNKGAGGLGLDPDPVRDILGSTAKGGVSDTLWGIYRERGKKGAKLAVTGRDIDERMLNLFFDPLTGCWQCEGSGQEIEMTTRRQEILEALRSLGGQARLAAIVEVTGQNKGNTYTRLQDMVNSGFLTTDKEGFYALV